MRGRWYESRDVKRRPCDAWVEKEKMEDTKERREMTQEERGWGYLPRGFQEDQIKTMSGSRHRRNGGEILVYRVRGEKKLTKVAERIERRQVGVTGSMVQLTRKGVVRLRQGFGIPETILSIEGKRGTSSRGWGGEKDRKKKKANCYLRGTKKK